MACFLCTAKKAWNVGGKHGNNRSIHIMRDTSSKLGNIFTLRIIFLSFITGELQINLMAGMVEALVVESGLADVRQFPHMKTLTADTNLTCKQD